MNINKIYFSLLIIILTVSCASNQPQKPTVENRTKAEYLYANKHGSIKIEMLSDTAVRVLVSNNETVVFDSSFLKKFDFQLLPKRDSLPFLSLRTAGLEWTETWVQGWDFGGPAYMAMWTGMGKGIYEKFYRLGEPVALQGDLHRSKAGITINGIYLLDFERSHFGFLNRYIQIEGTIEKERYPLSYYSTPESPQGMFSDTSVAHYRLVMRDYHLSEIPRTRYVGYPKNIDGQAAFIWDFSLSEAFYLDNKPAWTTAELKKKITVDGVLVQETNKKSVLKNWQIVEE